MKLNSHHYSVLFLSNGSFNLQLIAEGLARKSNIGNVAFKSASIDAASINPSAEKLMREAGAHLADKAPTRLSEVELVTFDLIVTIGDPGRFQNVSLPAWLPHFHWETSDADVAETKEENLQALQAAIDIVGKNIDNLLNSEFLHALFVVRRHQQLILDNMLDGILAHSDRRIIFFFNKAAERITSLKRENVLGKDCHDVFPKRFCGGNCDFCNGPLAGNLNNILKKRVDFENLEGERKTLEMMTLPLSDETKNNIGAMVLFKDDTDFEMLKNRLKHHHSLGRLITKDPKMLDVFEQIKEVAEILAPVLIEGESGTGKELVANAIHDMSRRADKPFVAVNCGALPEGILESELFGHVKGAFTGALYDKKGRFELAHQGTLFLDEVAELSPAMQVKLLRALQEKSFERVGGEKLVKVDIRIISATNQNLKVLMKKKKFRRDLFYRLCVVPINLPPLRDRRLDIPVLVEYFLDQVAAETERSVLGYSNEAIDALSGYSWPGNVRELRNAIEYAYVKSRDSIVKIEHLPPEIVSHQRKSNKKTGPPLKIKKDKVMIALSKTNGNRKDAADLLGIGRATLYRYLDSYGLK